MFKNFHKVVIHEVCVLYVLKEFHSILLIVLKIWSLNQAGHRTWLEEKKQNCSKNLIGAINWGGKGAFAAVGSAALIMRRGLAKTELYFSLAGWDWIPGFVNVLFLQHKLHHCTCCRYYFYPWNVFQKILLWSVVQFINGA